MFWKLIGGLLRKKSEAGREPAGFPSEPEPLGYSAKNGLPGRTAGNSGEELVRQANALATTGQLAAALERYRACVRSYPHTLDAYLGMGNVLVDLWSIDEAVAAYNAALELAPNSSTILSAILFHSHYLVPTEPKRLFELHRRFGELVCKTGAPLHVKSAHAPDAGRPLRIGYISPNFSRHSVGYFFEPVIANHDRERLNISCYYTHPLSDETTERIRHAADCWRHVAENNDDELERIIRNDAIDILVDLAGHSKGNRLGVLARKPAPIQMTWLGYPDTTGLPAIDFRITDRIADPAPESENWHTEQLLRMNNVFLCYQPPPDCPPIGARPRSVAKVVFASFNSLAKLNKPLIRSWARILSTVPGSRLVLKAASLSHSDTAERILECFDANGIAPERVELRSWIKDRQEHLELYNQIDIALDTYPYNGTTTTCESLWMGVPVVSLSGSTHMSRVGRTILQCVGLPKLVAESTDGYVDIAVALAHDQLQRTALRTNLRQMLLASPLLDHKGFTTELEDHFRRIWTAWCNHQAEELSGQVRNRL